MGTTFTLADGFDQTAIRTTSGSWDQTYSTVTANSSTWLTSVSGGIALVGTTVHLADPETLTQIAEADAVAADRMLIWDESASSWKYITVEDLQDEIDTGGGSGEANEYSFKTIKVDGQSDIVADTTTDTLSAMAGSNMTITTRAGTDTIVFAATDTDTVTTVSGGIALVGTTVHLADPAIGTSIDETTIATDDRMLIWDESASSWKYVTIDNLQDEIDTGGGSGVTAVSGGIALVGTTAHLADPETLTQIAEADAVGADRMLIWDESVSSWKYITIEDLQDEIDTTGGGGGGSGAAVTTDTETIKTFHSTDSEYHNVQLLLHCEGTNNDTDMDDDSRVGHHFDFIGNSKLSSTQKKFGSTSLFTGTSDNDHVEVDSDDTNFLELGTEDFTLEFWLYWDGVTGYQTVFDNGYGSGSTAGSWMIQTDNNNGRMKWYQNGGALVTEGSDPANTTWLHYAIVRSSGTLKIYRNGIQTATASTTNPYFTPDKLSIGARNDGSYPFDGYIDELRITKGVARYSGSDTSSTNFTVPTEAFSGEALKSTTVVTGVSGAGSLTDVQANSGKWNQTYSTVTANSASWSGGGIAFDGSTANGVLTYKDSDEATVESNLTFDGTDLFVANKITHLGDTDTYISFSADDINITAAGKTAFDVTWDGTGGSDTREITFNEGHEDLDLRIEGDTDDNLFFTNAGTDKVGIGTNVPSEKLTVAGTLSSQGIASVFGLQTTVHDYGTTANIDVDFDYASLQKVTLNGAPAIDTNAANKGAGKSIVIKILCDGSDRAFTWNSSWIFIGEKPASIAANKTAILSMTCFGTAEGDVVCSYGVQD